MGTSDGLLGAWAYAPCGFVFVAFVFVFFVVVLLVRLLLFCFCVGLVFRVFLFCVLVRGCVLAVVAWGAFKMGAWAAFLWRVVLF